MADRWKNVEMVLRPNSPPCPHDSSWRSSRKNAAQIPSDSRADHRVPSHVLPLHEVGEALRRRHRRLQRDGGVRLAVHEVVHLGDHSPAIGPCRCECEGLAWR